MDANEREDAEHLKALREAAGLNMAQLAAMANLSVGQMRQLEEGGESLFYSPQIKSQSLRRVIRLLENPLPSGTPTKVVAEEPAARAPGNVIDDIIRLSEKNLSGHVVTSAVRRPQRVGGLFASMVMLGLGVLGFIGWKSNQDIPIEKLSEWVTPHALPTQTDDKATAALPAPVAAQELKTEEVKTAPVQDTVSTTVQPATPPKVEPVAPPSTPLAQTATSDKQPCAGANTEATSVVPHSVSKPGSYVYLQATKSVQLCVDDGKKNRTVLHLEPGVGRSVHGSPPWVISSNALSSVNIYFQGSKLMLPDAVGQRIYLVEQTVSP